ncbi:MAG: 2-C-methyl-D-erythritol 4-phosphate cytidylyltransferase [Chlamydiales bacterium]
MQISVILLAGGTGSRMQNAIPKPFLSLQNKPLALHSLEVFLTRPEVQEIIVVAPEQYRDIFALYPVIFASPGARRQDSVFNGLQKAQYPWICVHDAARPFISDEMLTRLFIAGEKEGAAATGMPMKFTVKEAKDGKVERTLDRSQLWEIQTPQLLAKEVLERGFVQANAQQLTVTDDVSLAELIGHPVQLVHGAYENLKITTPHDWIIAEQYEA